MYIRQHILRFFLCSLTYYIMFKTPFGLRLRSVGEHPSAADTVGVRKSFVIVILEL